MKHSWFKIPCLILVVCKITLALNNGLALTPPMGWTSWNRFLCKINCDNFSDDCLNEKLIMTTADLLVSEGYDKVGYKYVVIDDCWMMNNRDADGKLQADKNRFPRGIKALVDYVHSKGLKFGIYGAVGDKTPEGYAGSKDHEKSDAQTLAEWGVDFVKLGGHHTDPIDQNFPKFGKYLKETGRPMVLSCAWPSIREGYGIQVNFTMVSESCNLWRNFHGIEHSYSSILNVLDKTAKKQDILAHYAGPGHWNDPDSLIIGMSDFVLSHEQSKTQMALWAILAAPLFMSNKLCTVQPIFKKILQNTEVIEVNQDKLGIQGKRIFKDQGIEVWSKPIQPKDEEYYSYAIAFVNRQEEGAPIVYSVTLEQLELNNPNGYEIKSLFADIHRTEDFKPGSTIKVVVKPTGVVLLRLYTKDLMSPRMKNLVQDEPLVFYQ